MKRTDILLGFAALLAAAVSCSRVKEMEEPVPTPQKTPVTFHANLNAASRTVLNEDRSVSWAAGDLLTVFDSEGGKEEFTVAETCDEFTFTATELGNGPYYAVAGYGTVAPTFDVDARQIGIAVPGTTVGGTFGDADLIAAMTEGTSFSFHHVFAILKMSVTSDDVKSLTFMADGVSAAAGTKIGFDENGGLDVIYDTTGSSVTVDGISGAGTYYFPVNPGSYEDFSIFLSYADKKMKIEGGAFTATIGKMVNFGDLESGTPGSTVWNLVTDASTLAAGDEIIIAASDYNYALSTTQNSNNRGAASITKSADKATLAADPGDDVQILTLTAGSLSETFGLYTGSGYLYAASSSKNYLKTQTSLDANASWTITVTSAGVATIKANGSNSRNTMSFNNRESTNLLFSAYSTLQQSVAVYKKVTTEASGPQMREVNAFLDETAWGVYAYNASSDIVIPLYQYNIRSGGESIGSDQYAVGSGMFRIQSLSEGLLAKTVFSTSSFVTGTSYPATVTLYGVDGYDNGTTSMTLVAKKSEDGTVWLLEEGGTTGFIISTK